MSSVNPLARDLSIVNSVFCIILSFIYIQHCLSTQTSYSALLNKTDSRERFWFGGYEYQAKTFWSDPAWGWSDGTEWDFSPWSPEQPTYQGSCVEIELSSALIKDVSCQESRRGLCYQSYPLKSGIISSLYNACFFLSIFDNANWLR